MARLAEESSFVSTGGRRCGLAPDEVVRVEREILGALSSGRDLPSLRELAATVGVGHKQLRRTIGSVAEAAQELVNERLATAATCVSMSGGWNPSLTSLGEDVV
ncbi:MAG: hypothetical protein AAGG08_12725, partial [Actinomycetota bacterium]